MKAISFIDYYASMQKVDIFSKFSALEHYKEFERKTRAYYELVSQSFVPEMILNVFDGWRKGEKEYFAIHEKGYLFICNHREAYSTTENTYQYIVFKDGKTWGRKFYWGSDGITLNDFISDCARAGIELEFKEEIAKTLA